MQYRREIDGLRALAIAPVILYHAKAPFFDGGYVGVDVFFVISGFLITSLIAEDLAKERFSFRAFYMRRVRRIMPASYLLLFATLVVGWFLQTPSHFKALKDVSAGVILLYSNVTLYHQTGYFSPAADENPLLHTWSLSIEEQYYLLFPGIMWLVWRIRKQLLLGVILAATILSFALSVWGARHFQSANFYLLPTRAWELLAGSSGALLMRRRTFRSNEALATLGIGMIVAAIFLYDKETPYPSEYALLPVGGSLLFILFGQEGCRVQRIMSHPLPVGLGLISYSLYLWHQPVFAFYRTVTLGKPSLTTMLVLTALSIVLAWLSWYFIETPFRRKSPSTRNFRINGRVVLPGALVAGSLLLIGSFTLDNQKSYAARLTPDQRRYVQYDDYMSSAQGQQQFDFHHCFIDLQIEALSTFDKPRCVRSVSGKLNVVLIGDSHAAEYSSALRSQNPEWAVSQFTLAHANLNYPVEPRSRGADLTKWFYDQALPAHKYDLAILSFRYGATFSPDFLRLVAHVKRTTSNVVVIGPSPEFEVFVPALLLKVGGFNGKSLSAAGYEYLGNRDYPDARLRAAVEREGVRYFDIRNYICRPGACALLADGAPLMFDGDHLTAPAAEVIMRKLRRAGLFAFHRP